MVVLAVVTNLRRMMNAMERILAKIIIVALNQVSISCKGRDKM